MSLLDKHCVPCEGNTLPLFRTKAEELLKEISPHWSLSSDAKSLHKTFKFKDWKEAQDFVNQVGAIAEAEGHHPDIDLHWGRVGVALTTHAIKGLSMNDFILAAKIDDLK